MASEEGGVRENIFREEGVFREVGSLIFSRLGRGRSAGFFLCLIRSGYRVMYS